MGTSEYHLFRVKLIKPSHKSLFYKDLSPSEILLSGLKECPAIEGSLWHMGNLLLSTDNTGKFAIGKTTNKTIEKYDESTKSFYESIDEASPYTSVIFDASIGVIAVCKKPNLAASTKSIAKKVKQILSNSTDVKNHSVEVRVDHIPDPTDFIEKIQKSYSITSFKSSFTGPNPQDADEIFQKPLSVYCQALSGEFGVVTVYGASLDAETVEAVAHASAATGNEVTARVMPLLKSKTVPISFKGDPTRLVVNSDIALDDLVVLMQEEYKRVRG